MALFWYWCMLMVALQHKWRFFYVHLLDTNEFGPFSWRVFSIRVFFHGHWRLTREGTIYSTLPLPSAHEHSDIYFAPFHVRWLSQISNCTACIFRAATWLVLPPYRTTIWLINDVMLIFVCLLVELSQGFCYSYLTQETGGLKLASTIILVLQANQLTKCASHTPSIVCIWNITKCQYNKCIKIKINLFL